jgi:hypothetical protein
MDELLEHITQAWFHLEYTGANGKKYTIKSFLMRFMEEDDPNKPEDKNLIGVNVLKTLLNLTMSNYTLLDDDKLRVMKKMATRILYAFLKGYEPFYKGKLVTIKRETLLKAIGMHRVAQLKGYRPARAQQYLEDALDELAAMDELDSTLEYERKKGKGKKAKVVTSYGWKYDKVRDLYFIRKRVPTPAELEAAAEKRKKKLAQPIEIERLAQDAEHIWRMHPETGSIHCHKSVFINVAKRAQALYDEIGHLYSMNMGALGRPGIHGLLEKSLDILFDKSEPAGAHFWAQALFWEQELPFILKDRGYLQHESYDYSSRPISDEEWEREERLFQNQGVPMLPDDMPPSPDYED